MTFVLVRAVHVLGVVLWIGGVAMVTTVLLPAVKELKTAEERVQFFEQVERRFATQSRVTTLVTGLSGFYMLHTLSAWSWLVDPTRWYVGAMFVVWVIFTLMLFVAEPLFLHKLFHARAAKDPEGTFSVVYRMHVFLLTISLVTVFAAVAGAHGLLLVP
jgi:uncharacterized membrane protein